VFSVAIKAWVKWCVNIMLRTESTQSSSKTSDCHDSIIYLEVTPNDVATMEQFMRDNGYSIWERLDGTEIGRAFRLFR